MATQVISQVLMRKERAHIIQDPFRTRREV